MRCSALPGWWNASLAILPGQQPSIDLQLRLVRACLVSSVRDLKLPHIVHENRAENAGHGPRSKQSAVNRADVMSTEQIAQVCGNRREAPPYMVKRTADMVTNSTTLFR
jgi:hypothetical protein